MDIRTTTLQQTALALGITEQVSTMSEANRQGLRFITMMRQASNASGDFARTIESPANQLKIFKEQMAQLGRAVGDLFIKPLSTALQYINGFVMALRMIISFIGNVLGVVNNATEGTAGSTEEVAGSIDAIGDSAAKATKKLKAMVAPFDELNILGSQADDTSLDVGTLDPAIQQAIEDMELSLENIKMKANEVRDSLLQFFGFKAEDGLILSWDSSVLEENLINRLPQWTQTIQATFANWDDIAGAFGDVLDALGGIAQTVWKKLSKIFKIDDASLASFIEGLDEKIGDFADTLRNNEDTIANFAIVLGTLAVAFRAFTGLYEILLPIVQVVSHLVTSFSGLLGIVGILGILYTSSTDFATAFDTLIQSVVAGLGTVLTSAWSTLQTIVNDIVVGIVPLFTSLGEALAPVVNTVTELWNNVTSIVSDAFQSIETMWNDSLKPVFDAVIGAFESIASIFQTLWTQVLGPVIDHIGDGIESLWKDTLKPIVENIVAIVSGIIELVLQLWNHVLGPIVDWLVSVLGPTIKNVITWVWDFIKNAFAGIGGIINGLLEVIRGVIDFIVGVFTGDWERAWNGIKDIFKGVWDALVGVVKSVMNGVIWLINGSLGGISGAINGIINAINSISFDVPDWVPGIGGTTFGFNTPNISDWQIPYLASGAVVTSPTVAMVGEGKYDEAVIPLGNSPQMRELVDRIAEATRDKGGSNEPVQVNVFIGNEQIAEFVYRADKRRQLQTNGGV
jgi:phage-related protein